MWVHASAKPVSGEGERRLLRVEVVDTGIGITEEAKARLFQPFSQGTAAPLLEKTFSIIPSFSRSSLSSPLLSLSAWQAIRRSRANTAGLAWAWPPASTWRSS